MHHFKNILVKGYIRKGFALMATKELSKAQSAFQKALELDENNAASYLNFLYLIH